MTLWWIGNILFIAVIIPVVVIILGSVLAPAREIGAYADDINEHGALFGPHLDALQELGRTRDLVKQANVEIERYIRAIDQVQ
ncbi:MAG: hypothetical protein M3386_01975 [Actinomycetota bacterium]|nr:hypothetical protein [Solirubrobacterales bacterium]MDQ3591654.1 hypothetical protein [Actinomycetota bacterium]